jgi:hypothetical protein
VQFRLGVTVLAWSGILFRPFAHTSSCTCVKHTPDGGVIASVWGIHWLIGKSPLAPLFQRGDFKN